MGKQSIYLNDQYEDEVRDLAMKEGCSISEIIRRSVESNLKNKRHDESIKKLERKLNNVEDKVDALFSLFDLLSGEIAYISGATRASTKSIDDICQEATRFENSVRRMVTALRKNFERNDCVESEV